MKTTAFISTILLGAAAVSGCERRDEARDEPAVEEQRAERAAFTTKARERLRQLDARINQIERNTEQRLRKLTQQAKVAVDDDDKRDIQDREKKLRDKWNDELEETKRERNELKSDIDSLEMRAYSNWNEAKRDTNKAFDEIEGEIDDLTKDIEDAASKAVDKTREELREEGRELEQRNTHD